MDLKKFRRNWGTEQKQLRTHFKNRSETVAKELFLSQHEVLHSSRMSGTESWSYADSIFNGLDHELFKIIPPGEEHSLTWILWHLSRIEDITMNILVAGGDQIYIRDNWKTKLQSPIDHTGNAGKKKDLESIAASVPPERLFEYRDEVGRGTRNIIRDLPPQDWHLGVQPDRLDRLVQEKAVLPEALDLLAYWGKRRIFELFLMPPTRHLLVHLNEAHRIKGKLLK